MRGAPAAKASVPLSEILLRYWHGHAKALPSAVQARVALALWQDHWDDATLADVTPERQEAFWRWLAARGLSWPYIARTVTVGRAAISRAYRRQEIDAPVAILAPVPPQDAPAAREPVRLTIPHLAALADASPPHLLRFLVASLCTMARPGAVLELEMAQVDDAAGLVFLNPPGRRQTKKRRPTVPLADPLACLVAYTRLMAPGARHVVTYGGEAVGSIKTAWRLTRARAGLPEAATPYAIRHTMATEMRARGVPAWEVAGWLGHKMLETTETYAVFAPGYLGLGAKAVAAVSAEVGRLSPVWARATGGLV